MVEYRKQITFVLLVDGDNLPEGLPDKLVKSLIDNLNISNDTNDIFSDSIQENMPGDVVSFKFEAVEQSARRTCDHTCKNCGNQMELVCYSAADTIVEQLSLNKKGV